MKAGVLLMVMVCLSGWMVTGCSVRKIIIVSKLSKARVSCPSIMANSSDIKFLLLFNDSCISQLHLNKQSDSAESLFSGQFDVTAYNSGVYVCKRQIIYPPPFVEHCHTTEVIVAEKRSSPVINDTVPVTNQSCPVRPPFIPEVVMWVGCGILLVYSLLITCITLVRWRKPTRDKEDTNVYANTRPAELRKPWKI